MRSHNWVFECALDALHPTPQRLSIQVFDDGTMTGTVEDLAPDSPLAAAHEGLVPKPPGFQFYVLDGSATWRDFEGEEEPRCRCQFKMMRFSKRLRQGQFISCEAELLPTSHSDSKFGSSLHMESVSVRHCIRAYSQDLQLSASCWLQLVEQSVAPSITPLVWRMTAGSFTFKGFTLAVSGMLYECTLALNLAEDGSVSGFSEDLIHSFIRKSKLHGFWSADCVTFQLVDDSGEAPHVFIYSLAPHPHGLRGSWHERATQKRGYFQEGHVELAVESVHRSCLWSPSLHSAYPFEFQSATRECLNVSRVGRCNQMTLPQDVWETVFSNCAYDWF